MGLHSIRASFASLQVCLLVLSLAAALPAQTRTPKTVFSNNTSVTINAVPSLTAPTAASVYPSQITVGSMTGTITRVAVTLNGVSHQRVNDLDFLLVGPTGAKYIFLSDVGASLNVDDRVWTIADDAANTLPLDAQTGNYKPTSGDAVADTFPSPAPAGREGDVCKALNRRRAHAPARIRAWPDRRCGSGPAGRGGRTPTCLRHRAW